MLKSLNRCYHGVLRTSAFVRTLKTHDRFGSDANQKYACSKVNWHDEDGYVIHEMTAVDAETVHNWFFCTIGHISPYDLNVAMSVCPPGAGFYIGEKDGVAIVSFICIPWAEGIVYRSSYYYVAEQYRHAVYGSRLKEEGSRQYIGRNIIVGDSIHKTVSEKNRKNGFEYAFKTVRFQGVAQGSMGAGYKDCNIVKVSDIPFSEIIDYDNKCFVRPNSPIRRAFLEKWLTIDDAASFAALNNSGHVVGYGQRRPCLQEKNHLIGPLYADHPAIAKALLQSLCSGVSGENVIIDIMNPNEAALEMVQEFKMTEVFTADRMHLNGDPKEYRKTTFGLTSLHVCGF